MRKVLVAGGAGFIGSHLCEALLQQGDRVTCIDNLSSGSEANLKLSRVNEKLSFVKGDVRTMKHPKEDFDVVVNLASRASRVEWEKYPIDVLTTNAEGNTNLLEYANARTAKFVYISSSEIYGDPEVVPTPESYSGRVSAVGPRSSYDEGKRYGEALVLAYHRERGMDGAIVRLFNTYGPRIRGGNHYGRVIPRFIEQALSGAPLKVYGDGTQTRSFAYVSDVVDALIKMIDVASGGEIYNVGHPEEIPILEVARKVITVTRSKSTVEFKPLPDGDPIRRCPDLTRVMSLGWRPRVDLDEGLRMLLSWRREQRSFNP
jgi:nucleoside-diphosphate-sugar epimerase